MPNRDIRIPTIRSDLYGRVLKYRMDDDTSDKTEIAKNNTNNEKPRERKKRTRLAHNKSGEKNEGKEDSKTNNMIVPLTAIKIKFIQKAHSCDWRRGGNSFKRI